MVLFDTDISPFEQVNVALDLETTGLDSNRHQILEVGAVRFRGDEVIETYQTLVNPGVAIPEFIQRLTHISPQQVKRAPFFSSVASEIEDFLGADPIIGHNIQFDIGFLANNGVQLNNPSYDTWDLATVFMPRSRQYSLKYLTSHFKVEHNDAHRALADAMATKNVYVKLLRLAAEQDSGLLAYLSNLASRSHWSISGILAGLEGVGDAQTSSVGLTGLDLEQMSIRLGSPEKRRADPALSDLSEDKVAGLLTKDGPFAKVFSGFEHRPEQEQMLSSVTKAMYHNQHLVVEGGTGVGKSMSYLLPSALFAISKGQRVVISTNTINLQEQLMNKDIPALTEVLEQSGLVAQGVLKAALLKGRTNYLCLRRWNHLARSDSPTIDDARLLSKTSVWMQNTTSGDRAEINLSGRDAGSWSHVSAGEKGFCPGLRDGTPCFLRAARERAEQAHIVVVNHALLLSDLARGGGLIPEYQHLIIDEAHNLEDEATRQLGFSISQDKLDEVWEPQSRLTTQIRQATAAEGLASSIREEANNYVSTVEAEGAKLRQVWGRLWAEVERFQANQRSGTRDNGQQMLITSQLHGSQSWSDLHLAWENLDVGLQQASQNVGQLHRFLDSTLLPAANDQPALVMETANLMDEVETMREEFVSILGNPIDNDIHWISNDQIRGNPIVSLNSAPLDISGTLAAELFQHKDSVVLTSATLSTEGNFEYFKSRVGVGGDSEELLVGSPFDYQKAALLLIPEDMPPPNSDQYVDAMVRVLTDLGTTMNGHTMALFTSYASLRAVAQRLRAPLMGQDIQVLAQSIDGSAQQLMTRFAEEPNSVLLGTASFWEGVDLPPGLLKALVLTRLPFAVPTDPVVMARSNQYENPFSEFSVPQAVLRFRQGFGRLIRNKADRGTIVIMDNRITGKSYGSSFLKSIPPCTLKPSSLTNTGQLASQWLA
ncbi:MAG: DEAD/DEAH box helicase family protein [Dehalococcoidia bacterium]|nr:DEAD/DEAH box helicase family protein [Dehalococcoidia bacterium]|tara:strand:+ start:896 stop:3715 length:2820 start_codon:yes stop_codon:yes gene_type:complete